MRRIVSTGLVGFDGGSKGAITMVKPRKEEEVFSQFFPCNLDPSLPITFTIDPGLALCPDSVYSGFSGVVGTWTLLPYNGFSDPTIRGWAIGPPDGAAPPHPVGFLEFEGSPIYEFGIVAACISGAFFVAVSANFGGIIAFSGGSASPTQGAFNVASICCCEEDTSCIPLGNPYVTFGKCTGKIIQTV